MSGGRETKDRRQTKIQPEVLLVVIGLLGFLGDSRCYVVGVVVVAFALIEPALIEPTQ